MRKLILNGKTFAIKWQLNLPLRKIDLSLLRELSKVSKEKIVRSRSSRIMIWPELRRDTRRV